MKLRSIPLLLACSAVVPVQGEDVLARSRTLYGSLKTYRDSGTVETELKVGSAPALKETHRFATFYRGPREYYFEFNKDPKAGNDRLVVWGDGESFHRWWGSTGVDETFPRGQGAAAFSNSAYPTKGSILQMAPLLFANAGLQGALSNVVDAEASGTEVIDGKRCYKLIGVTRDIYTATQKEVNFRRTTVWIDAETNLVRRILEDTPRGTVAGTIMRVTTTFEPKANPRVETSRFRFTAPSMQQ